MFGTGRFELPNALVPSGPSQVFSSCASDALLRKNLGCSRSAVEADLGGTSCSESTKEWSGRADLNCRERSYRAAPRRAFLRAHPLRSCADLGCSRSAVEAISRDQL